VLSREGQLIWYAKKGTPGGPRDYDLGKLPLDPSLYGAVPTTAIIEGNPFTWKFKFQYDAPLGGRRWNLVNDLFGAYIIDAHDLVVRARRFSAAGLEGHSTIPACPVSAAEAELLTANAAWNDPARRSAAISAWGETLREAMPISHGGWWYLLTAAECIVMALAARRSFLLLFRRSRTSKGST
jgi:hypothetical protein